MTTENMASGGGRVLDPIELLARARAAEKVAAERWEEILRLRGQIEEARNAWWSATEEGDNGLVYTDRIEDAMDEIWSAIGHADWTPQPAGWESEDG